MPEAHEDTEADDGLPVRLSPWERHRVKMDYDLHPVIEEGMTPDEITNDGRATIIGSQWSRRGGDRLIGFMERNECPVCGEHGTVSISDPHYSGSGGKGGQRASPSWAFTRGVERGVDALDEIDEHYRPIICRAGTNEMYVGLASLDAIDDWIEYRDRYGDIAQFKTRTSGVIPGPDASFEPENSLYTTRGCAYSYGELIAGIYEALGAEDYDARDLIDRTNVTKDHLVAILIRLWCLDITERRDLSAEDWLYFAEWGVSQGVQWHYPEWVDTDGLTYEHGFRTKLFDPRGRS